MLSFGSSHAASLRIIATLIVPIASALSACADERAQPLAPSQPERTIVSTSSGVLDVTPLTYDFGSVQVGQESGAKEFKLTNSGVTPLYFSANFAYAGANPDDFADVAPSGPGCSYGGSWALPPGESCYTAVLFRPTATGARAATLDIATTGGNTSVALSGTGLAPAPTIKLSPDTVSFGSQIVGTISQQTVKVENVGTADLTLSSVSTSGGTGWDFMANTNTTNGCPIGSPIAPGQYCNVVVVFAPIALGARGSTLTVAGTTTSADVKVRGTGVAGGDVAVSMSVAQSGKSLTYTIGVANLGPTAASGISLGDAIPSGTSFSSASSASDVICTKPVAGGTGTLGCTIASMASGDSRIIKLTVRLDGGFKGSVVNTASVITMSLDPTSSNDSATATTQIGRR
ncbi:MAG: choice-of-anchor D domain-containing protein [Gemmatimonadaceae bacterium]